MPTTGRPFQAAFFQRMGCEQQFRRLFEDLPEVGFFAKDEQGRFVAAASLILKWAGCTREEELLGRDDSALHSPETIREVRMDDRAVMESGQPLFNRVEMLFIAQPGSGWYCTTKRPLFDQQQRVIGIMGVVRPYHGVLSHLPQCAVLAGVVRYIEAHYAESIPLSALVGIAGCTERQLNRHFQTIFRMSAQAFIVRHRVQAAMAALHTDQPLAQIASTHGFSDQSHFTRQFRAATGETPAKFRARLTTSQR
ncbi:MAG: hypothetical protein B7Z55_16730 [Planctomycetales bacterium 12-60-4]|nr:MAG: hypothetical protein B7Z55_16730 [Planctomycetales bacterium 12-60-4]